MLSRSKSVFIIAVVVGALSACRTKTSTATSSTQAADESPAGALQLVADHSQVCMVNNRYMGSAQIPTEVAGKTYYGCCAGCKAKLETSSEARTATDPVSGKPVDKAAAFIGRDDGGKVYYFETEANLKRFRAGV